MTNIMLEAFADAMRPPSRLSAPEWCSKNVKLPHSARSPQFDISATPWLREPMLDISDNDNKEVVIVAPVGSGKTTLFEGLIPWIISEEPGPTLVTFQTDDDAKQWAETRLQPSLKMCDPIKGLFPEDRHKTRKLEIIFPHMPLHIGGANISNLQSKSTRWVICDEVWLWKQGMIEEARRRTHDRWNSRLVLVSQGSTTDDDFHKAYTQTDQRIFKWLCSGCNSRNVWNFKDILYDVVTDANGKTLEAHAEKTARMRCPNCDKIYKDNVQERRTLSESSIYEGTNPAARHGHIGFTYNVLCVWWVPWGKIAVEFIKANEAKKQGVLKPLEQFTQKRLGEFWSDEITDNRAALIAADYKKADYVGGTLWDGETYRIMTVDVQRDHFWMLIRAWKVDGSSRLLWEGKVLTWESLRELQQQYNIKDKFVGIDSQYRTDDVYCNCSRYGWIALKGDGKSGFIHHPPGKSAIKKLYSPIQKALASNGKQAIYIFWSNEKIKDILSVLRGGAGAAWEVPQDISDAYKEQIDSEIKKDIINKVDKSVSHRWVKIKKDNHLWDCENMNLAIAIMLNIIVVPDFID